MTTLTDRYVWAAARTLPEAQRAEFDRELRERIGDAIDALVETGRIARRRRAHGARRARRPGRARRELRRPARCSSSGRGTTSPGGA